MTLPSGTYNRNYAEDMAIVRTKLQWAILIACLIILFLLPLFASSYVLTFLIYTGIGIIAALGLNLLTGYCGQISIGHAAFMAVGAFTCGHLLENNVPFLAAVLIASIVTAGVGLVFGLPSLRIKGFYLALSTLAAQFILIWLITHFYGGDIGVHMPVVTIGGITFGDSSSYWYIVLVTLLAATFVAKSIARTKMGRAFIAIRDNDIAAEAMGINIFGYKLLAFSIACFYAGVAGSLWASFVNLATVEHYTLWDSVWYLGIVIVGGVGSIAGTFFGAFFIRGVNELAVWAAPELGKLFPALSFNLLLSLPVILFSVLLIAFVIYEPRGLAHRWGLFKASYRLWPWAYW